MVWVFQADTVPRWGPDAKRALKAIEALDGATGQALAVIALAGTPASDVPSVSPCPDFVPEAYIDDNIDRELPAWMHAEVRAGLLRQSPCSRRGDWSTEDKQGRFISNRLKYVVESAREHARAWKRLDLQHWSSPSGDAIPMPESAPPAWLVGRFVCREVTTHPSANSKFSIDFGANGTGWLADHPDTSKPPDFIYQWNPSLQHLYVGYGHDNGSVYDAQTMPGGIALSAWGSFDAGDETWNAMPEQFEFHCARGDASR